MSQVYQKMLAWTFKKIVIKQTKYLFLKSIQELFVNSILYNCNRTWNGLDCLNCKKWPGNIWRGLDCLSFSVQKSPLVWNSLDCLSFSCSRKPANIYRMIQEIDSSKMETVLIASFDLTDFVGHDSLRYETIIVNLSLVSYFKPLSLSHN